MNISHASKRSSVPAKTIRYYESIGLIPLATRLPNGYRDYTDNDVSTLQFVQRARNLGFTLKDVESLVALWQDQGRASADVKKLALNHIAEIESRITELQSVRDVLVTLSEHCHGDNRPECPILKGLEQVGST
jgi:Cu(I)-responsive transcriptional regulator